jgi:mono/diheme cytochrome c family protein
MSRKRLSFVLAGIAIASAGAVLYTILRHDGPAFIDPADETRVMQGRTLYANHCAACHGASLQGQPNWRDRMPNGKLPAPPHDKTGHTWHHPDAVLIDIVKNGLVPGRTAPPGYVFNLPAYGAILYGEVIIDVLTYIKSTWPPEILKAQKEVTLEPQN